jgi:hypothetical protein
VDYHSSMAFVAADGEEEHERIMGVARYPADPNPNGRDCEFAVAVADAWQARGVGATLTRLLLSTRAPRVSTRCMETCWRAITGWSSSFIGSGWRPNVGPMTGRSSKHPGAVISVHDRGPRSLRSIRGRTVLRSGCCPPATRRSLGEGAQIKALYLQ